MRFVPAARFSLIYWLLLSLAACVQTEQGAAANWQLVTEVSLLRFEARFDGALITGQFTHFNLNFDFNPKQAELSKMTLIVALAGTDLLDDDLNQAVAEAEWFDTINYPEARFVSEQVTGTGPGMFLARGLLSLKGFSKQVSVPFSWRQTGETTKILGELMVRRTDFDVGSGEWASNEPVHSDIRVFFDLTLRQSH